MSCDMTPSLYLDVRPGVEDVQRTRHEPAAKTAAREAESVTSRYLEEGGGNVSNQEKTTE